MKAKLEFDLNDPDDKRSHLRCIKALDMGLVLLAVQDRLRKTSKYDTEVLTYEEFGNILMSYDVQLDELIN